MLTSSRLTTILWLTALAIGLCCTTLRASAGDLPAVSDGEHLWLIQPTPVPEDDNDAEPTLALFHLPAETDSYLANKLPPIKGELMPRGLAAGDGRLLLVTAERQLITIRPIWSDLLRSYEYQKRTLTELPEGCTLLSLAMGERGPWALVQVQTGELLKQLDARELQRDESNDQADLNRALGLPEDYEWDEPQESAPQPPAEKQEPADQPSDAEEDAAEEPAAEAEEADEADEPALPAYRLIYLHRSKWTSSPLPDDFDMPREARLIIRPNTDRPIILVDETPSLRGSQKLVRYNPEVFDQVGPGAEPLAGSAESAEQPTVEEDQAWTRVVTNMQLRPGRQWSAALVDDQIFVAIERFRPQEVVTIDTFHLYEDYAYEIGYANISTGENARWALLPKQKKIGLLASPAPPPDPNNESSNRLPTLAMLAGLTQDGQPLFRNKQGQTMLMPIAEKKPTAFEGNADLIIQILAFIIAMFMMVMFYRRAPQQDQLDLPEHLVLASFSRRAIAGMIDLAPGFILAGLIYGLSVGQIMLESWPGNGIEKAFAAMRPGFIVIGVTLFHTTVCEFILARSLGKIVMGMYVADLNGKPAPPMPCVGRALSRAFELFAPLMILVAVISPARQRLGDILARTTVVMRKPEPPPERENNDDY